MKMQGAPLITKKAKSAASCRQGNRNEYLNALGEGCIHQLHDAAIWPI